MAAVSPVKIRRMGETDGGFRVLQFEKPNGKVSGTVMVHFSARLGDDVWVGEASPIGPRSTLGAGSFVAEFCHIGHYVEIGKNCLIESGTTLGSIPAKKEYDRAKYLAVSIGDNCYIAGNCQIAPKVKIGNHVRLGRGCQVSKGCVIGDDVEIPAYYTLEKGVKIPKGSRLKYTATRVKLTSSKLDDYLVKKKKK